MNLLHSRRIFDYVSRHLVCHVPLRARRISLTFDDGPNPKETPRLLRLLDQHDARATFFLVGRNVERFPALAAEIAARGHEIGNHTHNHVPLTVLPYPTVLREMERAGHAILAATGHRPELFRPPMGWFSRRLVHALAAHGYRGVLGNVYPQDCNRPGAGVIVDRVMARIEPGAIVILHDGSIRPSADRSQGIDALEAILPRLAAEGYAFDTVTDLLAAGARQAAGDAAAGQAASA